MERITVKQAASVLGVSEQFIRIGMQRGLLPIGTAVKMKQWCYHISPYLLEQYIGKAALRQQDGKSLQRDVAERTM